MDVTSQGTEFKPEGITYQAPMTFFLYTYTGKSQSILLQTINHADDTVMFIQMHVKQIAKKKKKSKYCPEVILMLSKAATSTPFACQEKAAL